MARAREPRFLGSARQTQDAHTHIGSVHRLECVHMCARGAVLGAFGRAARAHTVPTTARSPFSVLMAAHKPSGVRGVRGPCRAHSTQGSDGGSGRRAAHRWARCVHGSRAPRSACTRAALSTQPMRSAGAGRQATWGSPARSAAHRGAHQLLSCDGLSGVNGSVASRGVSAAYTIHVRVYIFATARAAAANIAEREASQQPTPRELVRNVRTMVFHNGPRAA